MSLDDEIAHQELAKDPDSHNNGDVKGITTKLIIRRKDQLGLTNLTDKEIEDFVDFYYTEHFRQFAELACKPHPVARWKGVV